MKSSKSTAADGAGAALAAAALVAAACSPAMAGPKVAPLAPTVVAPTPAAGQGSAAVARGRLVVDVTALRNDRGLVGVAVFCGPDGFPGDSGKACARARVTIVKGTAEASFDALPAGSFAVAVLHDEDSDGRMATSWAGIPTEGYGASRDARRRFGAPRWSDARLELGAGEDKRIVVKVGY